MAKNEVRLYQIDSDGEVWSFRPEPGVSPTRVQVPAGCRLREVAGLGTELSVPTKDKLVRALWSANMVMRATKSGEGRDTRFKNLTTELVPA